MESKTRKLSILETITHLNNNEVLLKIEKLLQEQAKELYYHVQSKQTENLYNIEQKPRRAKTDITRLAREQNYNPKKELVIGALPDDDISFEELSNLIGK